MRKKFIWKNKKGVVGIGTMIIFIALVLVAAIGSAVIIKTAYGLKNQAETTGQGAEREVSGSLKIADITGDRGSPITANIQFIRVTTTVWDGSKGINIADMKLHYQARNTNVYLTLSTVTPNTPSAVNFGADEIPNNQPNNGWDEAAGMFFLDDENVLWILLDLSVTGINDPLPPFTHVVMYFIPGSGPVVKEEFTTPSTYGSDRFIDLTNA
ncbi:MAG: archaellin/type IV pilin N-terminal domain-containing protein [Candidatus Thermoplasmatota archaeon]